jgi:hypothetical protein
MIQNKSIRILAIAPLSRGLGYAVMEGQDKLVACGNKSILRNKNAKALAWVNRFIQFYQPDVLVLPDVTAADTRRAARIKALHQLAPAESNRGGQAGCILRSERTEILHFAAERGTGDCGREGQSRKSQ